MSSGRDGGAHRARESIRIVHEAERPQRSLLDRDHEAHAIRPRLGNWAFATLRHEAGGVGYWF